MKMMKDDAPERAKKIELIAFDVDGVLTDGRVNMGPDGEAFKSFDIKDGLGITQWQKAGWKTAIITGRESEIVARRAAELHITAVYQGCLDKRTAYGQLKERFGLSDEAIAYMGDDLIDLPLLTRVGLAAAVADAVPEIREMVHLVTEHPGGRGAAREFIEFILRAKGRWEDVVRGFSV